VKPSAQKGYKRQVSIFGRKGKYIGKRKQKIGKHSKMKHYPLPSALTDGIENKNKCRTLKI
jgi:hypothetical protein